jgi:hypothetical protein
MKGSLGKDASGRITYDCIEVPAVQYKSICDLIVTRFGITPLGNVIQGLDEMFQDFQKGSSIIGIEWDIWSGLSLVAKTPCSINLLQDIGSFLQGHEVCQKRSND